MPVFFNQILCHCEPMKQPNIFASIVISTKMERSLFYFIRDFSTSLRSGRNDKLLLNKLLRKIYRNFVGHSAITVWL